MATSVSQGSHRDSVKCSWDAQVSGTPWITSNVDSLLPGIVPLNVPVFRSWCHRKALSAEMLPSGGDSPLNTLQSDIMACFILGNKCLKEGNGERWTYFRWACGAVTKFLIQQLGSEGFCSLDLLLQGSAFLVTGLLIVATNTSAASFFFNPDMNDLEQC